MATIDKAASLDFNVDTTAGIGEVLSEIKTKLAAEFKRAAWSWFNAHRTDVIFSKKIVFFTINITVNDCRAIVVELAGPEPV